jgi:S-DNA-T family DNA segregation ATPase FtsK/SpoIIIE
MTRVLVTVIGPNGRHHLWLPPRVPLRDLLPAVLQATAVDGSAPWRLRPKGGPPLRPDATLAEAGVLQGAVLLLQPEAGDGARPGPGVAPPPRSPASEARAEAAGEETVELVVRGGPGAGRRARLEPGEHRLGSRGETPVALDDPCLAPVHLVVRVSPDGEVSVAPARPGLEVALDGVRLGEPRPVAPGERVALGRSLLSLERPGRPAPERRDLDSVPRLQVPTPPAHSGPVGALAALLGLAAAGLGLGGEGGPALALGLLAIGLGGWLAVGWWRFGRAQRRVRERLDGLHRELGAARRARLERLEAAAPDAPRLLADLARGALPTPRWRHQPGWLRLRLGWADQPSGLRPVVEPGGSPRLRAEATLLAARHAVLPGAPVTLALPAASPLGLCGDRLAVLGLARWLAFQVVLLHRPQDVIVCAALPETERERWAWLGRLPHAAPFRSPLGGSTLSFGLEEAAALHRRLRRLIGEREGRDPALVAILDADLIPGGWDLAGATAAGVHLVWLGAERLRSQCAALLDLRADGGPLLELPGGGRLRLGGVDQLAGDLACRAAGLGGAEPSLLELLGVEGEVERRVLEHWIRDRAGGARRPGRAVLGLDAAGRPVEVDLDRDLLITGSEAETRAALTCLVASLAVRRSPRSVGFLFVGDPGPLGRLPHLLGVVGSVAEVGKRPEAAERELVVVIGPEDGEALRELAAPAGRESVPGMRLVVASAGAAGPVPGPARRVVVGSGTTGAAVGEGAVRPPGGEDLPRLVAAIAALDRRLHQG